jgi:mono/diheme cytochrome c family protein
LSRKDKYSHFQSSVPVILLLGVISAWATCVTGYLLSGSGEYDEDLVQLHQWMGIGVAVFSTSVYVLFKKNKLVRWQAPIALFFTILILITGHLGGSLTHGSDYLTKPLENLSGSDTVLIVKRKPIPDIRQAMAYKDVIEPIFQSKCYSCHSTLKQKGKLRLDQPDLIMKGGKDGVVIIAGKAGESEMIKRVKSAREEEHHMPPKEKPQLNEKETALLEWWINSGADFTRKVSELNQPEKIKPILKNLENASVTKKTTPVIPGVPVEKADENAVRLLREKGVIVMPVAQGSNYLRADFITASDFSDRDIRLLLPLQKQLLWLNIGHTAITDSALAVLAQCKNITELQINHTAVSDGGMEYLKQLDSLQTLNLVETKITGAGLMKLVSLKKLRSVYLYHTALDKKDWVLLQKAFPKTMLDSGGYSLPYIESDTQVVKPPVMKR